MSKHPAGLSDAIAVVSRGGEIRERHRGDITAHPGLAGYLRTAARIELSAPLSFVWNAAPDTLPAGPPDTGPQVLRVRISPASRPSGGCYAEVRTLGPDERCGLTGRELQVLTLLACGLTNPGIATRLAVSRRTAATHVERLLGKLGVTSRAGAAAIALDRDLLTLPVQGDGGLDGLPPLSLLRLEAAVRGTVDSPPAPAAPRRRMARLRPLMIGAVYPSAGDWFGDGLLMEQGTRLAMDEINERGGIAGRRIEHIPLRTNIQDTGAIQRAIGRLASEDVDAITTGYTFQRSRDSLAAQFLPAASAGFPLLHHSTSASAADLIAEEPEKFGNVFQVCGRESVYGIGFVRTLTTLRDSGAWRPASNRLQVFDTDDADTTTFTASATEAAERAGWRISVDHISSLSPNWPTVIRKIHDLDPAAVMVAQFSASSLAAFVRGFREEPTGALLYALYSPSVPLFLDQADSSAEGLLWATVSGLYGDHFGHEFGRRFHQRSGITSGMSSAGIRYDMVHLLAAAWAQCDSPHDAKEVNRLLRRTIHRGVNGSYHFGTPDQTNLVYPDQTNDPSIAQAHLVYQIQNGHHHIIAPAPYSTAPFRPPGSTRVQP